MCMGGNCCGGEKGAEEVKEAAEVGEVLQKKGVLQKCEGYFRGKWGTVEVWRVLLR